MEEIVDSLEYSQYKTVVDRFYRNWNMQCIFTMLGIAFIFNEKFDKGDIGVLVLPAELIAFVIPIFLPYLFLQAGYLLGAFFVFRQSIENKLLVDKKHSYEEALRLCDGFFVFDNFYRLVFSESNRENLGPRLISAVMIAFVIGLNHATGIYHIVFAPTDVLPVWLKTFVTLIAIGILAMCYYQFHSFSTKTWGNRGTNRVITKISRLTILWAVIAFFVLVAVQRLLMKQ